MEDLKYINGSSPLYLKEVTYNYEGIREYIKHNLSSFTFLIIILIFYFFTLFLLFFRTK